MLHRTNLLAVGLPVGYEIRSAIDICMSLLFKWLVLNIDWGCLQVQCILMSCNSLWDHMSSCNSNNFSKAIQSPLHNLNRRQIAHDLGCARRLWKSLTFSWSFISVQSHLQPQLSVSQIGGHCAGKLACPDIYMINDICIQFTLNIPRLVRFKENDVIMMRSWHGETFHITDPLWGNPPDPVNWPDKRTVMQRFDIYSAVSLNMLLTSWTVSDTRRFNAYKASIWCPYIMVSGILRKLLQNEW